MRIKRFFIPNNYFSRIRILQKKYKINKLEKSNYQPCNISFIWNINTEKEFKFIYSKKNEYSIFGIKVNLEEKINWQQDRFSNFIYPQKRFDKLKAEQLFDKGIELKFPWELSRFYFAIGLGQKYLISKDEEYYNIFKSLVLDWIDKNPFLYGVNWLPTMEVAIRSINWIVSFNLFADLVKNDEDFKKIVTQSLLQHAEYINSFPEIYENGLTTNHTSADYTGLLFLALSLQDHIRSKIWMESAVNGLERCIKDQVYDDGVDFEGSIPYHRLVLELFAYSVIAASANNITFSKEFYVKLFKMFEFSAAYLDKNGNAPQIGDNDSGRLLIFNAPNNGPYEKEHDHSYLLNLGEQIFNHNFKAECQGRDCLINNFLPKIKKLSLSELKIIPRDTVKSISFENGGAYIFKNKIFDLCVSCFPIGQKGKGGHNHLDVGSFTLSIDGEPIIVDPGSYCYSKNRKERDRFRIYSYHNTIYNSQDANLDLTENGYWSLKNYYNCQILRHEEKLLELKIKFVNDNHNRFRRFELFEDEVLLIDKYDGKFFSRINLHPSENVIYQENNNLIFVNKFKISIDSPNNRMTINDYEYSPHYGKKEAAKYVLIETAGLLRIRLQRIK